MCVTAKDTSFTQVLCRWFSQLEKMNPKGPLTSYQFSQEHKNYYLLCMFTLRKKRDKGNFACKS